MLVTTVAVAGHNFAWIHYGLWAVCVEASHVCRHHHWGLLGRGDLRSRSVGLSNTWLDLPATAYHSDRRTDHTALLVCTSQLNNLNLNFTWKSCPWERWRSIVMSASVCMSVCICVCLSVREHTRDITNFLCMSPMAMARSFFGWVAQSQSERAILGFSSPLTMLCMGRIAV